MIGLKDEHCLTVNLHTRIDIDGGSQEGTEENYAPN